MPKAYIIARSAISYRRYITRSGRNGYNCKKPLLSGRQKRFFTWSRIRESNPPSRLGKPLYYRYTNPAGCRYYIKKGREIQPLFVEREICEILLLCHSEQAKHVEESTHIAMVRRSFGYGQCPSLRMTYFARWFSWETDFHGC